MCGEKSERNLNIYKIFVVVNIFFATDTNDKEF